MAKEISYKNEKDVKKRVRKLLEDRNWWPWMPPANGFGKVGISDFHALRDGVFLAIETKFGYNKPTVQQRAFLETILSKGGIGLVVNDKNIWAFEKWLDLFDKSAAAQSKREKIPDEDGAAMLEAMRLLTELIVEK